MNKIIKEIIFGALFLAVVILMIGILFYEFIPNQIIPDGSTYKQTSSTAKLISQIQEEQQTEKEDNEKESVLKSYEITTNDLDNLEDSKKYVQGKNHPFYDYTKVSTETNSTAGEGTSSGSGSTTSSNPDDIGTSGSSNTSSNRTNTSNNNATNSTDTNRTNSSNANSSTSTNRINTNGLRDTSNTSKTSK